ncbi:unnamed protein product [Amoebophrya sp. A25]|nr:unnamed protein product [Amoebophrya sp. A25]|eukprot:GSA25T00002496001.1
MPESLASRDLRLSDDQSTNMTVDAGKGVSVEQGAADAPLSLNLKQEKADDGSEVKADPNTSTRNEGLAPAPGNQDPDQQEATRAPTTCPAQVMLDISTPRHDGGEGRTDSKEGSPGGLDSWYDESDDKKVAMELQQASAVLKQQQERKNKSSSTAILESAAADLHGRNTSNLTASSSSQFPAPSGSSSTSSSSTGHGMECTTSTRSTSTQPTYSSQATSAASSSNRPRTDSGEVEDPFAEIIPVDRIMRGAEAAKSFFSWGLSQVAEQINESEAGRNLTIKAKEATQGWLQAESTVRASLRQGFSDTSELMSEGLREIRADFDAVAQDVTVSTADVSESLKPKIAASRENFKKFASSAATSAASAAIWFQSMGRVDADSDEEKGEGKRTVVGEKKTSADVKTAETDNVEDPEPLAKVPEQQRGMEMGA